MIAQLPRGTQLKPESAFDGSNRFYRGRVVAALRELPMQDVVGIDLRSLGPRVRADFSEADVPWLYEVVQGLAKDGLAHAAEDPPAYDAGADQGLDPGAIRVRLP